MDASASQNTDAEDKLFGIYLNIENPYSQVHNKPVVKYTRLPDFDLNSKALCSQQYITLEPRVRRIITIEEPKEYTTRSLKSNVALPLKMMASKICKRKIVTIEEDDEISVKPKLSDSTRKSYTKTLNKATDVDLNEERKTFKNISQLAYIPKYPKDTKSAAKTNLAINKKEAATHKFENRHKYSRGDNSGHNTTKNKEINDNESIRSAKSAVSTPKFSLSKKLITSKENEKDYIAKRNKLKDDSNIKLTAKVSDRTRKSKSPINTNRSNMSLIRNIKEKNKTVSVIHVPLDENLDKCDVGTEISEDDSEHNLNKVNSAVQAVPEVKLKNVQITASRIPKVDQVTSTDEELLIEFNDVSNDIKETFDSLEIPNVSLINSKTDISKEEIVNVISNNATDITTPNLEAAPQDTEEKPKDTVYHKSSYIIGQATLTYTTRQKINFHVVENNKVLHSRITQSPYKYPLNVVSVFKKELSNKAYQNSEKLDYKRQDAKTKDEIEHLNHLTSFNCSYVFNNDKLVKPSDIISTIKVNNTLLHGDYLCGQFQRELNFIDSFFESLQYLEDCSISDKGITEKKVENWIGSTGHELKNFEFGTFLSQFENEFNVDYTKTMASESLCLLNLLIQDEQIRAENLLDVLKMREDALKDFTKSQILWLEDKKKQDNTDISTLKKKQRGALLKLQHECGEMQRMRKALLTLSEQRKLALKKTKKNIELKLRNSSDVEQIILGKKKLKRNISTDRNAAPLKCFELSSSGCDDSTTSRPKSNASILFANDLKIITSAEKWVQTGDSLPVTSDQATNTSDENFVVVDGGYLNILFHNLSLPKIFSPGKQYEVNKEALKNIVHTTNMHNVSLDNDIVLEEFMEQIKNHELDSSSPSTARSLLEEFDQIYKGFSDEDSKSTIPEVISHQLSHTNSDIKDLQVTSEVENVKCTPKSQVTSEVENVKCTPKSQVTSEVKNVKCTPKSTEVQSERVISDQSGSVSVDECCSCEPLTASVGTQSCKGKDVTNASVTGPLPIPAGAAATDDVSTEVATWLTQKSSAKSLDESSLSSQVQCSSVSSLASPVLYEAEELRRQQLAIEREIKALEQQQCQLLAVREIPDKPPPPYTPPTETRVTKPPKFTIDDVTDQKMQKLLSQTTKEPCDADVFDIFVKDYCQESIERQKLDNSEKYWNNCNMQPAKPKPETDKLTKKAAVDLKEVLRGVPPTTVSGVGARRSDHIDDILFAEWRRCEPEWTSLHADEVIVKNQVFESIFQKILTETVDEYKRTVSGKSNGSGSVP